ncbi:hypothetical protein [Frankia sp. CiP3]|uniref:hypothetical protein n=1 Tax=Frankia sp. CiP3 TaxID=2880971 RepID=UPI001EF43B8F|nr:hypothetical protein [Frankia sp. CiP3]
MASLIVGGASRRVPGWPGFLTGNWLCRAGGRHGEGTFAAGVEPVWPGDVRGEQRQYAVMLVKGKNRVGDDPAADDPYGVRERGPVGADPGGGRGAVRMTIAASVIA